MTLPPPAPHYDAGPRLGADGLQWQRVSPRYLMVDLVGNIIGAAIPLIVTVVGAALAQSEIPGIWVVPAIVLVVGVIACALTPRRVRSIGYLLREDDLVFRRGVMFQRIVAVPYGRMQLVDITRGPIARAFGLAELKLLTATSSTGIVIPGLPIEEAERLRDHLVAVAESRRAGL